jgi:hypothetical protein
MWFKKIEIHLKVYLYFSGFVKVRESELILLYKEWGILLFGRE